MSALLESSNLSNSLRRIGEPEAMRTIGRLALTSADPAAGLESIAAAALRLPGLHGVQIKPSSDLAESDSFEWHASRSPAPCGSAMASIVAESRDWGRLRILFEPRISSVECPLRFARFLGQQTAVMLNRIDLVRRQASLLGRIERLQERLEARKLVARAAGVIAASQEISQSEALSTLLAYAREWRRTPSQIASSIVLGQNTSFGRPHLRQLQDHELTLRQ
jgi:hypothetical protein